MLCNAHHVKRKACKKIFMSDFIHGGYPFRCLHAANGETYGSRNWNCNKSKRNRCTNYEHKVQRNEKLGLYTVIILGPRSPKGKVLKIERN